METTNLSDTLTASMNMPQNYHQFKIIHRILRKCFIPYIFSIASLGIVTNVATVILLSRSHFTKNLRNKWTLTALALSDLLFNISLFCRGIQDIILRPTEQLCVIISFLSNLAEVLSAFFIVSFTIQRYTAVHHPLQAAMQSRSSPLLSLILIFIGGFTFCLIIATRGSYDGCHEDLSLYWFIADAIVSFVIPFFLISMFNVLIVILIRRHLKSQVIAQSILLKRRCSNRSTALNFSHDERSRSGRHGNKDCPLIILNNSDEEQTPTQAASKFKKNPVEFEDHISLQPTHLGTSIMKSPSGHLTNLLEPISRSSLSSSSYSVRSLTRSSSFNDLNDMKSNKPTRSSQSIRTTKILILVSTCFLILNAPAHFFIIATKLYTNIDTPVILEPLVFLSSNNRTIDPMVTDLYSSQSNTTQLLSWIHSQAIDDGIGIHLLYITILITQYISYASYSINFFLYSLSGLSFRTNLKQWTRKLVKNRAETSVM